MTLIQPSAPPIRMKPSICARARGYSIFERIYLMGFRSLSNCIKEPSLPKANTITPIISVLTKALTFNFAKSALLLSSIGVCLAPALTGEANCEAI